MFTYRNDQIELYWLEYLFFQVLLYLASRLKRDKTKSKNFEFEGKVLLPTVLMYDGSDILTLYKQHLR